jgi:hypothetical protein
MFGGGGMALFPVDAVIQSHSRSVLSLAELSQGDIS